ncbi:TetR/AcrR family transcriptional regulator [Streptomyces sp. NPDC005012]|uniref:TetR/AcrR family transcriptional regulator n=1 Tax=Streptomyces sp. NPDC005012 TaxID=3154558 RepID=UPI0033B5736C
MASQTDEVVRPGGSSRRSRITPEREREFFDAVLELIRESGYEAVTMDGVAAATRCSKSTLYRQWKTKPQFVAAALRARRQGRFADVDTGSLAGDLRKVATVMGERSGRDTRLFQALGHAVTVDSELRGALRESLVAPEVAELEAVLRRGVDRGEVPAGHPALPFVPDMLFGVLRMRPVVSGRYADSDHMVRFVDSVVLPALGVDTGADGGADPGFDPGGDRRGA